MEVNPTKLEKALALIVALAVFVSPGTAILSVWYAQVSSLAIAIILAFSGVCLSIVLPLIAFIVVTRMAEKGRKRNKN